MKKDHAASVALAQSATSERSDVKAAKPAATASKTTTAATTANSPATARAAAPSVAAQSTKPEKSAATDGMSKSKSGGYEGCHGKVVAEADL